MTTQQMIDALRAQSVRLHDDALAIDRTIAVLERAALPAEPLKALPAPKPTKKPRKKRTAQADATSRKAISPQDESGTPDTFTLGDVDVVLVNLNGRKMMQAISLSKKTYVPITDLRAALGGKSVAYVYGALKALRAELEPQGWDVLVEQGQGYYIAKKE